MDTDIDLDQLGFDLAEHGIEGHDHQLARLAHDASEADAPPAAAAVLADRSAPAVMRARAFAAIARHLTQQRATARPTTDAPPSANETTSATSTAKSATARPLTHDGHPASAA